LLAFAADGVVEPHIDYVEGLFSIEALKPEALLDREDGTSDLNVSNSWERSFSRFLKAFCLFLEKGLSSLAITFGPPEILRLVEHLLTQEFSWRETGRSLNADEFQCIKTLGEIASLACIDQSKS
jgi:hypothetical protein